MGRERAYAYLCACVCVSMYSPNASFAISLFANKSVASWRDFGTSGRCLACSCFHVYDFSDCMCIKCVRVCASVCECLHACVRSCNRICICVCMAHVSRACVCVKIKPDIHLLQTWAPIPTFLECPWVRSPWQQQKLSIHCNLHLAADIRCEEMDPSLLRGNLLRAVYVMCMCVRVCMCMRNTKTNK